MGWLIVLGMGKQRELAVKTLVDRKDLKILFVDTMNSKGYSVFFENFEFVNDITNVSSVKECICNRVLHEKVVGVLTFLEHLVPTANKLAREFGVEYTANFENGREKYLMREILSASSSMQQPKFYRQLEYNGELEYENELCYPLVLKPVDMTSGLGVRLVNNSQEAKAYFDNTPNYNNKGYLIEEFVNGQEYSAEGFIENGEISVVCITKKRVDNTNNLFVECGHELPVIFSNEKQKYINEYIAETLELLKLDSCVFHLEFKINEKGECYFIEVAARPGGDFITDLLLNSRGVNLYNIAIDIAIRKKVKFKEKKQEYAGIRYVLQDELNVKNITNSRILNVHIPNRIKFSDINSNLDRKGYVQLISEEYDVLKRDLCSLKING